MLIYKNTFIGWYLLILSLVNDFYIVKIHFDTNKKSSTDILF